MNNKTTQYERIRSYLLRQMSAEHRAEFEEQYSTDSELFDEVVAAEDKMIGAYLRGEGSVQERQLLEDHVLNTPAGRERLEFAKSLMEYVSLRKGTKGGLATAELSTGSSPRWTRSSLMRIGVAAVWLIGVVGGSWLAIVNWRLRHQQERLQAEQQDLRRQSSQLKEQLSETEAKLRQEQRTESELQQQISQLEMTSPRQLLVLSPRLARGPGNQKSLVIVPRKMWVQLQVNLQYDDYPQYIASLETPEGNRILHRENLKSRTAHDGQPAILINLAAKELPTGTYILRVSGTLSNGTNSTVGEYSFSVTRR